MTSTSGQAAPAVPELRWRKVFRGEETEVREVRRWLTGLLPECPARDDAMTAAAELAANAVRHTSSGHGGWFAVEIAFHHTAVRIVVADQGAPTGPRLRDNPDPLAESGRGLQVVRGLATRTGVAGGRPGRLVWAEVPWGADAPEVAPFPDGCEAAIRDGHDLLTRRHAGVLAWFGRATLQWWAVAGHRGDRQLVAADSPDELSRLLDALPPSRLAAGTPERGSGSQVTPVGPEGGTPGSGLY